MAAETDENDVARLIRRAHDGLPEPDERRLAEIEAQVIRRDAPVRGVERPARWRYGWIALALAASGSAAALWWVLDYDSRQDSAETERAESPTPPVKPAPPPRIIVPPNEVVSSDNKGESGQRRNPVIYRQQR